MTVLAMAYVILLGLKGLVFIQDPSLVAKLMGLGILVLPLFALWAIWLEIRFGVRAERLAKTIKLPELNLVLRPSGRATKESAAREFERVQQQVQANDSDWQNWFRLGQAYDAMGERKAARAAIRKAIALSNQAKSSQH